MKNLEILKETKYLQFIVKEHKPKTKVVAVVNKTHQEEIGEIRWYSAWRQYCFFPYDRTIWNKGCLTDINDMITELTPVRPKPKPKTIGVIAASVDDFQKWRIDKKHRPSKKAGVRNTQRLYTYRNNTYYCVSKETHVCGMTFDLIIETKRARENKNYDKIMTYILPSIRA